MKVSLPLFLCFLSCTTMAQTDDYCPCMDPPKYFDENFLDTLVQANKELLFPYHTISTEPKAILVTDDVYHPQEREAIEVVVDKPINIAPSDFPKTDITENINVSPREKIESEIPEKTEGIKKKRKRKNPKVKRRKKGKKYRGGCPSF